MPGDSGFLILILILPLILPPRVRSGSRRPAGGNTGERDGSRPGEIESKSKSRIRNWRKTERCGCGAAELKAVDRGHAGGHGLGSGPGRCGWLWSFCGLVA
jgi:hypothetical protein